MVFETGNFRIAAMERTRVQIVTCHDFAKHKKAATCGCDVVIAMTYLVVILRYHLTHAMWSAKQAFPV